MYGIRIQVLIPTKVILVDCIHIIGLSIKRETLTSSENVKPAFCRQYILVSFKFFSEIRDYSSTITLTQKYKLEENCQSEGTCIRLNRNKKLFPLCHNFLDLKYHEHPRRSKKVKKRTKETRNGVTSDTFLRL